jgi:glutathione peroxidase
MAGLQVLEEELSGQGFHVLGFFSNDFQQGGSSDQIDACNQKYGATFPEFEIDHVTTVTSTGEQVTPQPVWDWILSQPSPGPAEPLAPVWNFHKYLISRDGELVAHYGQHSYWGTDPTAAQWTESEVIVGIQAQLAQP